MRRDLDLVRSILLAVERADGEVDIDDLACDAWPYEEVAYHVRLMEHHGLIDVLRDKRDMSGATIDLAVSGLTWDGQDMLEAMRDDRVWRRARKAISESVGSTTFEVVKQTCATVAASLVRASLGM